MGLRETRAAWKRLLFFFACIAIGVGAIVALRSVIQSVRQVLSGEARTLLAADERRRVTRMVELRAIGPEFPLYGTIEMEDGRPYRFDALADYGALVRPELLVQLGLAGGGRLGGGRGGGPRR